MENTLYDVLGCDRKATAAEIRVAYLQRSREVHPDRTGDTSAEGQAAFQRVSAAFSVLSSTAARKEYDQTLLSVRAGGRRRRYDAELDESPEKSTKSSAPRRAAAPAPVLYVAEVGVDAFTGAAVVLRHIAHGDVRPLPPTAWHQVAVSCGTLLAGRTGGAASSLVEQFVWAATPRVRTLFGRGGGEGGSGRLSKEDVLRDGRPSTGIDSGIGNYTFFSLPLDGGTCGPVFAGGSTCKWLYGVACRLMGGRGGGGGGGSGGGAGALAVCALSSLPLHALLQVRLTAFSAVASATYLSQPRARNGADGSGVGVGGGGGGGGGGVGGGGEEGGGRGEGDDGMEDLLESLRAPVMLSEPTELLTFGECI